MTVISTLRSGYREEGEYAMPWDDDRLDAVEAEAKACESGDACTSDVLALVVEVRRLRAVLRVEVAGPLDEYTRIQQTLDAAEQEIVRLAAENERLRARVAVLRHDDLCRQCRESDGPISPPRCPTGSALLHAWRQLVEV